MSQLMSEQPDSPSRMATSKRAKLDAAVQSALSRTLPFTKAFTINLVLKEGTQQLVVEAACPDDKGLP